MNGWNSWYEAITHCRAEVLIESASSDISASAAPPKRPSPIRLLLFAFVFALGAYYLSSPSGKAEVIALRDWLHSLGPAALPAFVVIFAVAVAVGVPWSAMTVAAGALFPSWMAIPAVSVAATLGAGLAFLLSRYVLGHGVVDWLKHNSAFQRLNTMTIHRGGLIVAVTRLVPIFPGNLLNYFYGLTCISFATFVFWTWVSTFPEIVVLVLGGHVCSTAMLNGHIAWGPIKVIGMVGLVLLALAAMAVRVLRAEKSPEGATA